jgi:hypothetical protein
MQGVGTSQAWVLSLKVGAPGLGPHCHTVGPGRTPLGVSSSSRPGLWPSVDLRGGGVHTLRLAELLVPITSRLTVLRHGLHLLQSDQPVSPTQANVFPVGSPSCPAFLSDNFPGVGPQRVASWTTQVR